MEHPPLRVTDWIAGYPNGFKLAPLDFELKSGRILGLIGHNGCGKTTLLESLVGLLHPLKGVKFLDGNPIGANAFKWKEELAYVSATPSFYGDYTPRKYFEFLSGFYPRWSWELSEGLADLCGFPLDQHPQTLSTGQRMAVAMTAALSYRPRILIMDEPTSGLDPLIRSQLLDQVGELVKQAPETTVLITSHIIGDMARIANELAYMTSRGIVYREERARLEEQWQWVVFNRDKSGIDSPDIVKYEIQGEQHVVLTHRFDNFKQYLSDRGIEILQVQAPGLEEISIEILRDPYL